MSCVPVRALVIAGFVAALSLTGPVRGEVKLPAIFGDNMVLQNGGPHNIWGTADPGEALQFEYGDGDFVATTKGTKIVADKNGRWRHNLKISGVKPGKSFFVHVYGKNTVKFKNVVLGEVWVCSGQSNMEWSMTATNNAQQEIANAKHPEIRIFKVQRARSNKPAGDVKGRWLVCSPESVKNFSAVAYFFGRHLNQKLKNPVGLIETAWGGTPAEYWTPPAQFTADPSLLKTSEHPHAKNVMLGRGSLYNAMVAPLVPYGIKGAIWYQGESNVPMGAHYRNLFSGMIAGWRKAWGQGDFPFLYVQIAPWNYSRIKGWPREGCPLVQEAQLKTLSVKNTGMVVITDIGNVNDIHPRNKQDVGKRLAVAARAIAYGEKNLTYSGPIYVGAEFKDGKAIVKFDHTAGGLTARGGELKEFEIAGADRKFVPATAQITGETVVVSSDKVAKPVAVRFAFRDVAQPNLFNKAGLPASPFRTDSWPVQAGQ